MYDFELSLFMLSQYCNAAPLSSHIFCYRMMKGFTAVYWLNHLFYWLGQVFRSDRATRSRVLVLQPLPGIGDMVWHLPALNALAADRGQLYVMTKPRSMSEQLLENNPAIARVIRLERAPGKHDGLTGFFRLITELRRLHLDEAWVMHGSSRYTLALYLAGVPIIISPGNGLQKLFSVPQVWLDKSKLHSHPIKRAEHMLQRAGIILPAHEGSLQAQVKYVEQVEQRYPHSDLVILGIGSSEPYKQWGAERFAQLATTLLSRSMHVVLIGGPAEQQLADQISKRVAGPGLHLEIARPLPYITALLVTARAYVGNDTGVLNMALASGTPAFGLFGASEPLTHVASLHAIQPAARCSGMAGISAAQVYKALSSVLDELL